MRIRLLSLLALTASACGPWSANVPVAAHNRCEFRVQTTCNSVDCGPVLVPRGGAANFETHVLVDGQSTTSATEPAVKWGELTIGGRNMDAVPPEIIGVAPPRTAYTDRTLSVVFCERYPGEVRVY